MNDSTIPNPEVKVGSIFCMSWGYDQTNVNFFQVTRMAAKGVFVREIGYKPVEGSEGFMSAKVVADPNRFLPRSSWCQGTNVETFRKCNLGDKPSISFSRHYFGFLTNETEQHYNSWYA